MKHLVYRRSEIPDQLQFIEEIDLTVAWETLLEPGELTGTRFTGIEELNTLLEERLTHILAEKHAQCAHMKKEKVSHSVNYAHMTSVMTGEYTLALYGAQG